MWRRSDQARASEYFGGNGNERTFLITAGAGFLTGVYAVQGPIPTDNREFIHSVLGRSYSEVISQANLEELAWRLEMPVAWMMAHVQRWVSGLRGFWGDICTHFSGAVDGLLPPPPSFIICDPLGMGAQTWPEKIPTYEQVFHDRLFMRFVLDSEVMGSKH